MRTGLRGYIAFLLLIAGALAGVAGTGAAASERVGTNHGRIFWTRFAPDGSRGRIVSALPNGRGDQTVTHPPNEFQDYDVQVSPDGTEVLWERDAYEDVDFRLMRADADGTNPQQLDFGCADPCVADVSGIWGPNGDRVFFTRVVGPFDGPGGSAASAVLYSGELDGDDVQRESETGIDGTYEDYLPHFSPDGSYAVFVRIRNSDFTAAVFRMDADGSNVRRLTPWKLRADLPDLSLATSGPTEDLIVFETYGTEQPRGKVQNLVTVPATCKSVPDCKSQFEFLTHYRFHRRGKPPVQAFNPTWSPGGRQIAYTKFRQGTRRIPPIGDIYRMRADGTHRRAVDTSPTFDYRPNWGPTPVP